MTAPAPMVVWPGRRGDGETAYTIAVAASPADLKDAQRASHDSVVEMTGALRAGPVHWVLLGRANALDVLDSIGMRYDPEAADFLLAHAHAVLLVAMAKTDAPWRWPAPTAESQIVTAPVLDDTDRAMLRLAGEHWRDGSARDQVIRDRFGCSTVRFWQRIASLIDTPAALAVEPVIVHRLQRIAAKRRPSLPRGARR